MKKLNLTIAITVIITSVSYVLITKSISEKPKPSPRLAYNFVKCTPANFLLTDVDATKQISPLFNNLGNLNFSISTKNNRV